MKVKILSIPTGDDPLGVYLQSINGILDLTDLELLVLKHLIEFDPDNACSTAARKLTAQALGFTSVVRVNNIIVALVKKKVLLRTGKRKYTFSPVVILPDSPFSVEIQFVR